METRGLPRPIDNLTLAIAVGMTVFHMYTAGVQMLTALLQRSAHLMFMLALTFLTHPLARRGRRCGQGVLDWALVALSVACCGYILVFYVSIMERTGIVTLTDTVIGWIIILLVLEMVRRTAGSVLFYIATFFLVYTMIGPAIPGLLGHRGYSLGRIASQMALSVEGIFGTPLGVSASYIFLFIFLAQILEESGMGDFLLKLALSMTGRMVGGPAKTAVVASSLFGTISGSAVANVVGTGTFTIPTMMNRGYRPHFAAAVETAASTGGQIMPPIMGAAAFIMAEILAIPYISVAAAAVIPAVLYFAGVFFGVHLESLKEGLLPLGPEEIPPFGRTLREGVRFLVPLGVLLYLLIVARYSPTKAVFGAILTAIAVSCLSRQDRLSVSRLVQACRNAATGTITVASACAAAGLVVGSISLTGLGLKTSSLVIGLAGGRLWLALLLAMATCVVMGMGVPTTAAYLIVGVTGVPALLRLGIVPLAAHMFAFYFAVLSAVTPPVALAAYAAAGLAGTEPMKVGWTATKLTLAGFLIPFMFAYEPALLGQGSFLLVARCFLTALIGVFGLSSSVFGFLFGPLGIVSRALIGVGALLLIVPEFYTDLLGLFLVAACGVASWHAARKGSGRR